MFEFHHNTLGVAAEVLYGDLNVMSYDNYRQLCVRKKLHKLRGPAPGKKALVSYETLPQHIKDLIKAKLKAERNIDDPYKAAQFNGFENYIERDNEAYLFYRDYRYNDTKRLSDTKQEEYKVNAELLRAAITYTQDRKAGARSLGGKATKVWEKVSTLINELDKNDYPHTLPTNWQSLQRMAIRFAQGGYKALIHRSFGNNNSEKINNDAKMWVLTRWADQVKRCANIQQLLGEYNEQALLKGWKLLKDPTSLWLYLNGDGVQEIWYAHRYGELKAKEKFSFQNSTKMPTMRDSLWYSDGTKVNYFYLTDDGKMATTSVYAVMDAYSEVILGYAFSDTEDYQVQYNAFKMAVQTSGQKPYQLGFDGQGGHKKLETGSFLSKIAKLSIKTKPYNGKSKTIENAFGRFQQQYLKQDWFFTGQNIQSKTAESKANMEFIMANKDKLKTLKQIKAIYKQRQDEWNAAPHHQSGVSKIEMYNASHNEFCPKIEMWDMVDIFWILRPEPVTYNAYGLTFMDKREKYTYVAYHNSMPDLQWHSANVDKKFWIKFDPEDRSMIYVYDKDSKGELRFVRELGIKLEVARNIQEQEKWEADYLRTINSQIDEQRVQRVNRMEELLEQHGRSAADYGMKRGRVLGVEEPDKKERKKKVAVAALAVENSTESVGEYLKNLSMQAPTDVIDDDNDWLNKL